LGVNKTNKQKHTHTHTHTLTLSLPLLLFCKSSCFSFSQNFYTLRNNGNYQAHFTLGVRANAQNPNQAFLLVQKLNFYGLVFAPKAEKEEEEEHHPIWEANLQPFFWANVFQHLFINILNMSIFEHLLVTWSQTTNQKNAQS
jgi:hypothetical protein